MASIPLDVLRKAADMYLQPGTTWEGIATALRKEGHYHHRVRLRERCEAVGLLAAPGNKICPLCKQEFTPRSVVRWSYCDECRAGVLPQIISSRHRKCRHRGAYA